MPLSISCAFVKKACLRLVAGSMLVAMALPSSALTVGLAGVFTGRALLLIDGQTSRSVAVGRQTPEGVRLVAVGDGTATVEVAGHRQILRLGQNTRRAGGGTNDSVTLAPDARGHFVAMGSFNGRPIRFVVDTGASMISLGASDARRLGLDLSAAQVGAAQTAAGPTLVRQVRLDSVSLGAVTISGVDALVHENDLPVALLGMSFLNRMEMRRDSDTLTLKKRF
jgi:aspartyl protease family protein